MDDPGLDSGDRRSRCNRSLDNRSIRHGQEQSRLKILSPTPQPRMGDKSMVRLREQMMQRQNSMQRPPM